MTHNAFLVTGANAGLGKDVARQLAMRSDVDAIHLACRDPDYYRWSGGYSDYDRAMAATELSQWLDRISPNTAFDTVYAHSRGGNVALNAAAAGARIRLLVLLHTPANRRPDQEWEKIRQNVRGVITMRTRLDLVLLADSLKISSESAPVRRSEASAFSGGKHWKACDAWFSHSRFINPTLGSGSNSRISLGRGTPIPEPVFNRTLNAFEYWVSRLRGQPRPTVCCNADNPSLRQPRQVQLVHDADGLAV